MANEINVSVSLTVNKNGTQYNRTFATQDDMTGESLVTGMLPLVHNTEKEITTPTDLATFGWVYLHFADGEDADYIDFGHSSSFTSDDAVCRLYGQEACLFKSAQGAGSHSLYAKATIAAGSGTVHLEYAIVEL